MTDAQAAVTGKRVLVPDYKYLIAKGIARHSKAVRAEVVGPVVTVVDALDLMQAERLDGAVFDINLRGDLFPVADALIERSVPFVFATGCGPDAIPDRYAPIPRCERPAEPQALI